MIDVQNENDGQNEIENEIVQIGIDDEIDEKRIGSYESDLIDEFDEVEQKQ